MNAAKRGDAGEAQRIRFLPRTQPRPHLLKVLIVLLLVVLAVAVGALLWLEPYIDYSANGIKINLPFSSRRSRRLLRAPRWW